MNIMVKLILFIMNYRGGEFVNNKMKKYLKSIGVKFHLSLSDNKCSIIEIAQKNIQRRIYSYLVANETLQYINILPHICYAYNHSYHRGILMTPAEATEEANQQNLLTTNLMIQSTLSSRITNSLQDRT